MANNLKRLNKAYAKRLKQLNKKPLDRLNVGLDIFIEYLKFTRDSLIINEASKKNVTDVDINSLITAIAEFDAYIIATGAKQKSFHWENFCEFIKLNMEEWLTFNDSV